MDDFLTGLYEEEQEKIAAADLGDFMDTLPANELEEFLGLAKIAVAGPPEGELPDAEKGKLAKEEKANEAEARAKDSKAEEESKKVAMVHRLQKVAFGTLGQNLANTGINVATGAVPGALIGSALAPRGNAAEGALRGAGAGAGAGLGASAGSALGALAGRAVGGPSGQMVGSIAGLAPGALAGGVGGAHLMRKLRGKYKGKGEGKKGKEKKSQGMGEDDMSGMETTAAAKAKIAMRVMRVTADSPPHVKLAAARFAGAEMAKLAKEKTHKKSWIRKNLHESEKFQKTVGAAGGGAAGGAGGYAGAAHLAKKYGKKLGKKGRLATLIAGGALGAAGGAVAGGAAGGLGAKVNKGMYRGIDKLRGSKGVD